MYMSATVDADLKFDSSIKQVDHIGPWQKFWIVENSQGSYGIETDHFTYLSVRGSGNNQAIQQTEWNRSLERFDFVWIGNDRYCIRSRSQQNFLKAANIINGFVVTTQNFCGS